MKCSRRFASFNRNRRRERYEKLYLRLGGRSRSCARCGCWLLFVRQSPSRDGCSANADGKVLGKKALHATLDREMPKTVPIKADEASYLAGAKLYKDHCAVCHGLPGQPATAVARGMFPKPPELMQGKGVTDDEPGETYWKVVHGIRLTGMPGFRDSLNDTQSWQVSLLLANADKLPDSAKALLTSPTRAAALP